MLGSGPLGATAFGDAGDDDAGLRLFAATGHFVITGYDAGGIADRILPAEVGHFEITGHDAGVSHDRILPAETGHFEIFGYAAGPHVFPAEPGHFIITGYDAGGVHQKSLVAESGHFEIVGYAAGLSRDRILPADPGHLIITGHAAGPHVFPAEPGHFEIVGYDVTLAVGEVRRAEVGHFEITGYDATLSRSHILVAATGHFILSGYEAGGVFGSQKFNLIEALCIVESTFELEFAQDLSVLASGGTRGEDIGPPRWRARLLSRAERHDGMSAIEAEFDILNGVRGTFFVWNPKKLGPRHDRDGSTLGASVVTIAAVDGERISLKGLPVGYRLAKGDFLHFDIGSPTVRALHRVYDEVVADAAGETDPFRVSPAPFIGTIPDLAVTLIRPAAEMVLVPGSKRIIRATPRRDAITFEAEQVLA